MYISHFSVVRRNSELIFGLQLHQWSGDGILHVYKVRHLCERHKPCPADTPKQGTRYFSKTK